MATGMNTGMRTGSRAGLTAGRGAPGKPSGGGLGKIKDIFMGLSKPVKYGLGLVIVVVIVGALMMQQHGAANRSVDLYTTKMSTQDVKDCAAKLTELGIDHEVTVTGEGILIHPAKRAKAQAQLAAFGLPKHQVQTPTNTPADGINAKTQAEAKAQRQRMLEGEITETLRQFDGVADAYVKIAAPEEVFFRDDAKPTTATVTLKLTPGTKLGEKQVAAIVHMVSYSIPDLDKKNVKVVDTTTMTDLTMMLEQTDDGSIPQGKQSDMESAKGKELTKAAQDQLDKILGQGKSSVAVRAEMDFRQSEEKVHNVGGAGDDGKVVKGSQLKREAFDKDPNGGRGTEQGMQAEGEEADQASTGGKEKSKTYEQVMESKSLDYRKVDTTTVRKSPEIRRLTVSVAVDNLKKDQIDKIAGLVSQTVGLDESRGDKIAVESLPFSRAPLASIDPAVLAFANRPVGAPVEGQSTGLSPQVVGMALFGPAVLLLGLIGVFLLKQHRVQVNKSQLMLDTTSGGTTSTDIADLLTDKSGKTTANQETKVNTSDALEKLAKEKPTKVAEMLKSTWLSG